MAIKGIYRGLLFGSISKPDSPENRIPKIPIYGKLEIQNIDISFLYKPGTKGTKWKKYFIDGHEVEPTSIQRVKRIPEDYINPFESD